MKSIALFGLIALLIFTFFISGYLYLKFHNDSYRINQLSELQSLSTIISKTELPTTSKIISERDSLLRVVYNQKVKEEYYTTQMNIQSDWFIFFVSTLFIIFGLISYSIFRLEIGSVKEKIRSDIEAYKVEQGHVNNINNEHTKKIEGEFNKFKEESISSYEKFENKLSNNYSETSMHMARLSFASKFFVASILHALNSINYSYKLPDIAFEKNLDEGLQVIGFSLEEIKKHDNLVNGFIEHNIKNAIASEFERVNGHKSNLIMASRLTGILEKCNEINKEEDLPS